MTAPKYTIFDDDELGVLAFGLAMVQDGRGWPGEKSIAAHMDWTSRRAVELCHRRLQEDGYIVREYGRRTTWRPTSDAFVWAVDNPKLIRAARRREGVMTI